MAKTANLIDRQHLAIDMLVLQGMKKVEVARKLGVTPETISRWFNDPEFIKDFKEKMVAHQQELAQRALGVYSDLLDNAQSESVRASIAKDMLSRGGYDAPIKQEIKTEGVAIKISYDEDKE